MPDLDAMMEKYAAFEREAGRAITNFCAPDCSSCMTPCCEAEVCRESLDSPFLTAIIDKYPPETPYDHENGWITERGCALEVGRPPACYDYLCDGIIASIASPRMRNAIKLLASLVSFIGEDALGSTHLAEIFNAEDLKKIDTVAFESKLAHAQDLLSNLKMLLD